MHAEKVVEAWFLHEKLALSLLSENDAQTLTRQIPAPEEPFAQMMRTELFERALTTYLVSNDIHSLAVEQLHERLALGQLVWLDQAIAFKGVGAALKKVREGSQGRASFSARLATKSETRVVGSYDAAKLTCNSAPGQLSGTKRQFILGYISELSDDEIGLRPIVIATRWLKPPTSRFSRLSTDDAHLWPASVDQFAEVDFRKRLSASDLNVLRDVPEQSIKESFADILGEPDVPNDWGGEQFDLWSTDRLTVNGEPLRTAFMFKGPAKFSPMTIAALGKNGDQIDRLAQTAADLMVVQHCHSIRAPVLNMLKAYATNPRDPKRYMTIDGYSTIRILRHFGKL